MKKLPYKTSDYYRDEQGNLWRCTKSGWKAMKLARKRPSAAALTRKGR